MKNYQNDEKLRGSFNKLATDIFGINFEEWYQKGFWNDRYIPYSYVDGDEVIANVSVNIIDFVMDGQDKKAIQIGTVMTHPNYRNRGLSASLMNKVLEEYEDQCDFIYLFANQSVLDFYPKFGFHPVHEYQFSLAYSSAQSDAAAIRKLDVSNPNDLDLIYKIASERIPVSNVFGTKNTQDLLMFYCLYVFKEHIYFIEEEEAIVIYEQEEQQVDIFDIVSKKGVSIDQILAKITNADTTKIVFHFTPDYEGINMHTEIFNREGAFFVKLKEGDSFPSQIKHPITSEA